MESNGKLKMILIAKARTEIIIILKGIVNKFNITPHSNSKYKP